MIANTTEKSDVSPTTPAQPTRDCLEKLPEIRTTSIKQGAEKAAKKLHELVDGGCDVHEVRVALAVALSSLGRFDEAATQYRVVLKRKQKDWAAHWALAQLLILELKEYEDGIEETLISRSLDDMDENGYLYDFFLGKGYDGLGNSANALTHYRTFERFAAKMAPSDSRLPEARKRIADLSKNSK